MDTDSLKERVKASSTTPVLVVAAMVLVSTVALGAVSGPVFDDFEDGDVKEWEGRDAGDLSGFEEFNATQGSSYEGTYGLNVSGSGSAITYRARLDITQQQYDAVGFYVNIQSSGTETGKFEWRNSNDELVLRTGFTSSSLNVTYDEVDQGYNVKHGQWYRVEFVNINYSGDTAELRVVNASSGALVGNSSVSFLTSASDLSYFDIYDNTEEWNGYVDYISENESDVSVGNGNADGVDESEKLRIETREYLEHNTTVPFEVWLYNNSTDSYDNVTTDPDLNVTVENTSVVTVSGASITSTNDTTINQVTWVNATWEPTGVNDSQEVVVANETIENVDILPPMQKFTASVGTPDMQVVLIATGVGAGIGLLATSLAGIGGFTLVIIAGWLGGYSETHTLIAGLLIALFVGLNVSQLVEFNGR